MSTYYGEKPALRAGSGVLGTYGSNYAVLTDPGFRAYAIRRDSEGDCFWILDFEAHPTFPNTYDYVRATHADSKEDLLRMIKRLPGVRRVGGTLRAYSGPTWIQDLLNPVSMRTR